MAGHGSEHHGSTPPGRLPRGRRMRHTPGRHAHACTHQADMHMHAHTRQTCTRKHTNGCAALQHTHKTHMHTRGCAALQRTLKSGRAALWVSHRGAHLSRRGRGSPRFPLPPRPQAPMRRCALCPMPGHPSLMGWRGECACGHGTVEDWVQIPASPIAATCRC